MPATPAAHPSKPSKGKKKISFRDRLSQLTHYQAVQLLGPEGAELLSTAGQKFHVDPDRDVHLGGDIFRVRVRDENIDGGEAIAIITKFSGRQQTFHLRCDKCEGNCLHIAAALETLLTEKLFLGLSDAPDASVPLENLTEHELVARAMAERQQRAREEKMTLRSTDSETPWTDYTITSHVSGKTYRVALRGEEPGQSYCSCPDFRTNRLGTCKHIVHTLGKIKKRFSAKKLATRYRRRNLSLRLDYGSEAGLRFNLPSKRHETIDRIAAPYADATLVDVDEAVRRVRKLEEAGNDVHVYPDAEEWIEHQLLLKKVQQVAADIRQDPAKHPLRRELLKVELLPYQLDGVAFCAQAGRAILADDMGLGKTIQGIGVAELLARLVDIRRVLIVCPASLKSQWRTEIARFSDRGSQLVVGKPAERARQYAEGAFFTICNYEQVLRDLSDVEKARWDLIVLDEGQRIKNWESKTSQVIRSLRSRFSLVLSGTPLENRLDELYTVVRFVDDQRLGPAYRFFHQHRVVDEKGKVLGYHQLDQLREHLRPILLRRTRDAVMKQLPERTDEIVRIRPTAEQLEIHDGHMRVVQQIVRKKFLTEMDLLRLQKALLMCRMVANSTFLITKEEPEYSTKLERLTELVEDLMAEEGRKIVLFSEWRTMLNRIEQRLARFDLRHVRLDGQVPQKQRPAIIRKFQEDEKCRMIMLTNAGSTGLNLQSADTVINIDLPWNPAILEQRIARAHRMGQKRNVQVYKLVTEDTLEERLLATLASKSELAAAALDLDSSVSAVEFHSGMEELKRRLEKILGKTTEAPIDRSQQAHVESQTVTIAERRNRVASAGGQLLGAALQLVGELIQTPESAPAAPEVVAQVPHRARPVHGTGQLRPAAIAVFAAQ